MADPKLYTLGELDGVAGILATPKGSARRLSLIDDDEILQRLLATARASLAASETRGETTPEVKRLQAIIERERTWSHTWITRIRAEIGRRRTISQSRGSYEWDDEAYFKEFGGALDAIENALDKATRDTNCRDLKDCPTTQAEVDAARAISGSPQGVTATEMEADSQQIGAIDRAIRRLETTPHQTATERQDLAALRSLRSKLTAGEATNG